MNLSNVQADLLRRSASMTMGWRDGRWAVSLSASYTDIVCNGFGLDVEEAFLSARDNFDKLLKGKMPS